MTGQRIRGIEASQLRALVAELDAAEVDQGAAIALDLDDGVLRIQIDRPAEDDHDSRRTLFVVGLDAEVVRGAGAVRSAG